MNFRGKLVVLLFALGLVAAACGGDDDAGTTTTTTAADVGGTTAPTTSPPVETTPPEPGVTGGVGVDVDSKTIKLGLLADLTGIFSPLVIDIVDAQQVYWDQVNAQGGIGGEWTVEVLVEDTNYNVEQHGEKYEKLRDQVVAFTQSTGSPTTVSILDKIKEDGVLVIPLSWYSGWAIPEFDGGFILEQGTNYCIEAMNLMSFIKDSGGQTVALATFPGDYGFDSALGVKIAAEALGMEIVYDGAGAVIPGQDQTPVITGIVNSGADWVYVTTNPSTFAEILGGAFGAGFQGMWTGSLPTYNFALLDSPVGPLVDQVFYQSVFSLPWDADNAVVAEMREALAAAYPDRRPTDAFLIGWNEAVTMRQILEEALADGDLSRAGVLAAAQSLPNIDLGGSAPDQTYAGTPNDYVVRATAVAQPDLALYTAAGGATQTLTQPDGTTGSVIMQDFFISDVAADFDFSAPCYEL